MKKKNFKLFSSNNRIEKYDYLVTKEQPMSYTTESFQKVLINLDYTNLDGDYKVIQFTSTLASEGKSTFVSNLSYLLSQKGKKVIIMDLDLRKPKLHRVFNVANKDGLTDYLANKIKIEKMIRHSDVMGVDYIIVGEKTNAVTNILESTKLKDVVAQLRTTYDYVLLDSPPIIAVSDALYVSKNADGIIFIVAQDKAKKNLIKEAVQTLKKSDVPIIGTVLTQMKTKGGSYGYDYSYKYEE